MKPLSEKAKTRKSNCSDRSTRKVYHARLNAMCINKFVNRTWTHWVSSEKLCLSEKGSYYKPRDACQGILLWGRAALLVYLTPFPLATQTYLASAPLSRLIRHRQNVGLPRHPIGPSTHMACSHSYNHRQRHRQSTDAPCTQQMFLYTQQMFRLITKPNRNDDIRKFRDIHQ